MHAKISVIIPVYNVDKYLSKCIVSIKNQTYTKLEIILIDDGSTDESGKICDQYSSMDNRIKVIHKENGGLSDARNAGLDIATGDYVSFIDSDDYIHKKFYETLMNLIIKYDADIAQCEFLEVHENFDNATDYNRYSFDESITILNKYEAIDNLYNEEKRINTVVVWNKLYRKDLFNFIRYPKEKVHEDEYTTYKVYFSANKVVSTSSKMYYYLQRPNSIMGRGVNLKNLFDIIDAYYEQVLFYNDNNLSDFANKAKIRLDKFLKIAMHYILKSNSDSKNETFHYLINYYKKNYDLFSRDLDTSLKKKTRMFLYRYMPTFIVKILCNLL